ncbi:MAG: DUF4838 domain-containing protein, partial [Verrucomicrobiota bacterium]|nr:DUF4838 domain-containing protein [Verrucomicrobiota bacterium]
RTADNAQLCLTNREMIKALTSAVRDKLLENKDVDIISVSQNDNSNFCQCAECQSAMEDEGSLSGVLVNVVNTVAKELEKEFPSVMFETLAYQKTRKAPIGARPRGNVIIRYCTIEACPVHPLETDDFNAGVMRDLKDWTNITPNVYLWHYVTNFSHYFMPHPNWRSLPQDIKTFSRLKVKGVFLQGAFNAPHADFPEMRSWIAARLLLNPELKSEDLQKEFIQAYYGNAAGPLRRYLDLLMDGALQDEKSHLTCYSQPKDYAFMTPEWTARATKYMEEARKSVSGNKAQLERVNRAALSVEYAMAMRSFEWRQAKNPVSVDPIGLTKAFLTKAKASGALRLNEAESMEMSEARMLGGR